MEKKKAIVIGASSGIGLALAQLLSKNGYEVGLVARRENLLISLQKQLPEKSYLQQADLRNASDAMKKVEALIEKMGGVDLAILNAGVCFFQEEQDWEKAKETIDVNVTGFCAMAKVFMNYFFQKDSGHLVGISSIAAIRGMSVYSASKAFVSNYLEGLSLLVCKEKKHIFVTEIQPGFINTPMTEGQKLFWVTPVEKAAEMIFKAIQKKKLHAYISSRWRLMAWFLKLLPRSFYIHS